MEDSILKTIKKLLGIQADYDIFDLDIIININSAINSLNQLGYGDGSFVVTGDEETWSDYLKSRNDLHFIEQYIYLKVRLVFDPPSSSSVLDAMKQQISELEWRINVQVDPDTSKTQ